MVKNTITLMVATMGPIEFSANTDKKKPSAATVVMARAAKPKAPIYRQKTSDSFNKTT